MKAFFCAYLTMTTLYGNMEMLIPPEEIASRIATIAEAINQDYNGQELTVVMVMKGALCVTADLIRHLDSPLTIEYVKASSYGNLGMRAGELKVIGLDAIELEGKDVLVVDDIFDTGNTMVTILAKLREKNPKTLKSLVLLVKDVERQITYRPDYVLFDIPNRFVIGYGLDYKEHYRNLPGVLAFINDTPPERTYLKRAEKNRTDLEDLYREIVRKNLTMVTRERYDTIDQLSKIIDSEQIEGDIAECGVWRGGMSIYMAYAFPSRTCWVCDSFQGFETLDQCKYDPRGILVERHFNGVYIEPLNVVKHHFLALGLDETSGVEFLPGWVNDTTDPRTCPIEKLALLRIDVDAYSATLVVLENLFDKVAPGGYIIFDDTGLYETEAAIQEFERKRGIHIISELYSPQGAFAGRFTGEHGLYYRKPKLGPTKYTQAP